MSKKEELPTSTQELIKAFGTKNQLKKKLQSLPTKQLEKMNSTFAEVVEEIQLERQLEAEESTRIQNILEEALTKLSKEHGIPLDEIKARTTQL